MKINTAYSLTKDQISKYIFCQSFSCPCLNKKYLQILETRNILIQEIENLIVKSVKQEEMIRSPRTQKTCPAGKIFLFFI